MQKVKVLKAELLEVVKKNREGHRAQFAQYVMDDWEWKEMWSASNSKYLSR